MHTHTHWVVLLWREGGKAIARRYLMAFFASLFLFPLATTAAHFRRGGCTDFWVCFTSTVGAVLMTMMAAEADAEMYSVNTFRGMAKVCGSGGYNR